MKCRKPFTRGSQAFGCGQCMPCRISRRRITTLRLVLESKLHTDVTFATLTYEDGELPLTDSGVPTLVKSHPSAFIKRLRDRIYPQKIRYFGCGEYGDVTERPHYHVILFGYKTCLRGRTEHRVQRQENFVCCVQCEIIKSCWGHGGIDLRGFGYESAQYVAGYVTKKMTNVRDEKVRDWLRGRAPEFPFRSLRPGIGAGAMDDIARTAGGELFDDDVPSIVKMDGKIFPLGRYLKSKIREKYGLSETSTPKEVLSKLSQDSFENQKIEEEEFMKKNGGYDWAKYQQFRRDRRDQIANNIEAKYKMFNIKKGIL